jgi:hypothetical protein
MIKLDITKTTEHPDGTVTIEFETDESTLLFLAKIGMQTLIEAAVGRELGKYPDEEGTGDVSEDGVSDQV